jgi:hypothetical protein
VGKDGTTYPINKLRFSDDAKDHLNREREICLDKRKRKRELFVDEEDDREADPVHADDSVDSKDEPGVTFGALAVDDDNFDDSPQEDDDEDTATFRAKMIRFFKKFQLLLDEGFCSGVDPQLCESARADLDEIFDEFVW